MLGFAFKSNSDPTIGAHNHLTDSNNIMSCKFQTLNFLNGVTNPTHCYTTKSNQLQRKAVLQLSFRTRDSSHQRWPSSSCKDFVVLKYIHVFNYVYVSLKCMRKLKVSELVIGVCELSHMGVGKTWIPSPANFSRFWGLSTSPHALVMTVSKIKYFWVKLYLLPDSSGAHL